MFECHQDARGGLRLNHYASLSLCCYALLKPESIAPSNCSFNCGSKHMPATTIDMGEIKRPAEMQNGASIQSSIQASNQTGEPNTSSDSDASGVGTRTGGKVTHRGIAIPPGYFTRAGLREETGYTDAQLRTLEARGILKATVRNDLGWALYTMEDIDTLRSINPALARPPTQGRRSGPAWNGRTLAPPKPTHTEYTNEDAVQVFERLERGLTLAQIVLETRIHPVTVKAVYDKYVELAGIIMLSRMDLEKINKLKNLPGTFPVRSGEDIVAILQYVAKDRLCAKCRQTDAAEQCEACIEGKVIRKIEKQMAQRALRSTGAGPNEG